MKELEHRWEEDIREKVEQHEFDFDAQAWAGMEALLDEGGSPETGQRAPADKGGFPFMGKLGLLVLVLGGLLVWWLSQQTNTKPVELGGFNMMIAPKIDHLNMLPTGVDDSQVAKEETIIEDRQQKAVVEVAVIQKLAPGVRIPKAELKIPLALKVSPLPPLPTGQEIPMLAPPIKTETQISPPKPYKRKRYRRKLYPDVIENY